MHRRFPCTAAFVAAFIALIPGRGAAQVIAESNDELTVFLATYGPGNAVWEKFGHNAIWIRDASSYAAVTYNYGIFNMGEAGFFPRFLRGRMLYRMGRYENAEGEAAAYAEHNRSVWVQRLNLTAAQALALRDFLEANWAQDSGKYLYDYFRDNCSTRIRDAIDLALGGVLRATLASLPTETTYRSHSLRLTASSAATYTGLVLGLGLPTDQRISVWDETFVPMRLMDRVRAVRVTTPDGREVPLVAEEITYYLSSRAPPPDQPPGRTVIYLVIGVVIAGLLVFLGRRGMRSPRARLGWAIALSFWGVLTGLFGLILALLWLFTDHTAAYPNLNLLQANPLGFLLAVAAPLAIGARGRYAIARLAWPAAVALAMLSATGVLLQVIPSLRQMNGPIIALCLPIHFAVALTLYYRGRGNPSSVEDKAA